MSWLEALNFLPKPPDPRPAREIEGDILAELQFHLDMKARDLEAAGMNPETAREAAQKRFGDFDRVFQRCRRASLGEKIMLQRVLVLMVFLLTGAVVFLGIGNYRMNETAMAALSTVEKSLERLESRNAPASSIPVFEDISGQVIDDNLEPIIDAKVFLILKTWPEGRFRQVDLQTTTDPDGRFRFVGALPKSERSAINLTVLAEGFAFQSMYFDSTVPAKRFNHATTFQLDRAAELQLLFVDQDGAPFPGVKVVPSQRQGRIGGESLNLLYMQGSEIAWRRSQADGTVKLPFFGPGDDGKIYIDFGNGGGWKEVEIQVPEKDHVAVQLRIRGTNAKLKIGK